MRVCVCVWLCVCMCVCVCAPPPAGLAFAHARGVVHLDVKPENVRVCAGGGAVLVDFGLSLQFPNAVKGGVGTFATGRGSGYYKAPEVCV